MPEQQALIEQADRLGIPYTWDTTDAELQSLIALREGRRPRCFGLLWEAYPGSQSACHQCAYSAECLTVFAQQTLPATWKETGLGTKLEVVAEAMGVDPQAALYASQYGGPPPLDDDDDDGDDDEEEEVSPPKKAAKKAPPKKKAQKAAPENVPEVEEAPEPEAPKVQKKKKPKAKKSPPQMQVGKKAAPKGPSKAESASSAAGSAKTPKSRPATAKRAKGQADSSTKPVVTQSDLKRWQRERKRNPYVAALRPGMILRRTFNDQVAEVEVRETSYLYQGQTYPTLYSVVMAITGGKSYPAQKKNGVRPTGTREMAQWSTTRFFSLKSLAKGSGTTST